MLETKLRKLGELRSIIWRSVLDGALSDFASAQALSIIVSDEASVPELGVDSELWLAQALAQALALDVRSSELWQLCQGPNSLAAGLVSSVSARLSNISILQMALIALYVADSFAISRDFRLDLQSYPLRIGCKHG